MPQPNDLSRSPIALNQDGTLIAVIEMSRSSWLVAGIVPGIARHPLKKLAADEAASAWCTDHGCGRTDPYPVRVRRGGRSSAARSTNSPSRSSVPTRPNQRVGSNAALARCRTGW